MKRVLRNSAIALTAFAGVVILAGALFVAWPATSVPSFAEVRVRWTPSEAYLLDRSGKVLDSLRIDFGVRRFEWVPLEAISPALVDAVIDAEDRRFRDHSGIDWFGMLGAVRDDSLRGKGRGASTITMQLAALIDERVPARGRGSRWSRKLAQIRVARGIEADWTKPQILEAYLNLLDFRGEMQGIAAATRLLADKAPSGLNLPESVVLAALLPAPNADEERIVSRACARSRARSLAIGCDVIRDTTHAMLHRSLHRFDDPEVAPQLARALLHRPGDRIRTTLDASIQNTTRALLARQLAALEDRNVRDGAAIVVDNASGDVLAYVGSAGPNSSAGQVDGVRAHRQAGSTLKPFLYELALERRFLTAASLLDDSPLHLDTASGVYLPQDYDKDFKGLVSVRTALAGSLNVPAVRTLVLVGVEPFRERLRSLGYDGITEDGAYYGYSLALGSAEVSLWEQVQAYRALARGGHFSPVHVLPAEPAPASFVMPQAPAFLVADILSDRAARSITFGLDNHLGTPYWSAVKTGTSKDMRDNWCVGFSTRFTVAVWVGNFEGDAMHEVSGVTGAAPVWQEVMAALHADDAPAPPVLPSGVVGNRVEFSPAVEPTRNEWFLAATEARRVVAVGSASEIARIASPANGMVIAVDPDIPEGRQRLPLAVRGADATMVLRLNGESLGRADREQLWEPRTGRFRLAVEDANGRVLDQILFTVR